MFLIKIIKYFFQAILIYTFFLIGKILGIKRSRVIFSYIFKKVGSLIKSDKIIKDNLSKFSSTISKEEKETICEKMWANYGMTFIEYVFLKEFRKNNIHMNIIGEEKLEKISKDNKPVIFVSGHFANFELMSMEITKKEIKLATIYRPLNNFFLNPFMEYLRKKFVCKNQIKKGLQGVKNAIDYINKGHSIALMIDQRVSEGEKIDLFNHDALTTTLPAQLALKYNLDIVPIFIERDKNNLFNMEIYNSIKSSNFKDKYEISKKLNQILEEMITRNPNQWIWTHNRWK